MVSSELRIAVDYKCLGALYVITIQTSHVQYNTLSVEFDIISKLDDVVFGLEKGKAQRNLEDLNAVDTIIETLSIPRAAYSQ